MAELTASKCEVQNWKLIKSGAETEIYRNWFWRVGGRYVVFLISSLWLFLYKRKDDDGNAHPSAGGTVGHSLRIQSAVEFDLAGNMRKQDTARVRVRVCMWGGGGTVSGSNWTWGWYGLLVGYLSLDAARIYCLSWEILYCLIAFWI
jgi:hypothetical protein